VLSATPVREMAKVYFRSGGATLLSVLLQLDCIGEEESIRVRGDFMTYIIERYGTGRYIIYDST